MYLRTNTRTGFSVIEIVIYIGLLAMFSMFVIDMLFGVLTSFGKARIERNLSQQGSSALERIVREVRLADSVVTASSVLDTSPGDLKINTIVSPTNSTPITRRFFIQSGDLMLQEGLGTPIALTSGVTITNLVFHKAWQPNTFYYVRGSFAGCSDANDGLTPATAFCTISKASSVATAGNAVFVGPKPTAYVETVTLVNSGSPGNPIYYFADKNGTYTTDAPGTVTVDGTTACYTSGPICGFLFPSSGVVDGTNSRDYIIIDGFTITGSGNGIFAPHGADYNVIRNNIITGNTNGIVLSYTWGNCMYTESRSWIIENNTIHSNTNGINFNSGRATNMIVQNNDIYNNTFGVITSDGGNGGCPPADNVTLRHNKIHNNSSDGILGHIWFDGLIFNNVIYGNAGHGVYYPYRANALLEPVTIRNNTINANGNHGILFYTSMTDNTVIENNIVTNNAVGISSRWPFGVLQLGYCSASIRNNDVWSNTQNYAGGCSNLTGTAGNISTNPLFVAPPDFHLQSIATGHGADSPAINTGYNIAAAMGLSNLSTLTNNAPDTGTSDMGYHYGTITSTNPLFFLGNLRADAVRMELTVSGGSGKTQSIQNFYATAVLRRSY